MRKSIRRASGAFALGISVVILSACASEQNNGSGACAVGTESCECTAGGACDPGLSCLSNICVNTGGGGSSGAGGTGGSGAQGQGGAAGAPVASTCSSSAECTSAEICVLSATGGRCLLGSNKACGNAGPSGEACYQGKAYDLQPGKIEGPVCSTNEDCLTAGGHLTGVCADVSGDGSNRVCVPLCQYHDDPAQMACVTDPSFGLVQSCSRDHARLVAATSLVLWCGGYKMQNPTCNAPTASLSSALDWTLDCVLGHIDQNTSSCGAITIGAKGCFTEGSNPDAQMGIKAYLTEVDNNIEYSVTGTGSGSGSTGGQCSSDCDCGHCGYCEKSGGNGVCRYGGEGPYGCYRGCD
ncbi:MAG: hypothetical protein R3B13_30555 [Polyangiaceae bacterium]